MSPPLCQAPFYGSLSTSSRSKSESRSGLTSPTSNTSVSAYSVQKLPDNPFQNDQLPIWQDQQQQHQPHVHQQHRHHHHHHHVGGHYRPDMDEPEVTSSPETGNQDQAYDYSYRSLYETPSSPDLMMRRLTAESIGPDVAKMSAVSTSVVLPEHPQKVCPEKMSLPIKSMSGDVGKMTVPTTSQPQCLISGASTPASRGDLTPQEPPEVIQVLETLQFTTN